MTIRWRVLATDEAGVVRVDVDTGNGFRAATVAEVDQALRQLPLFGAADIGAHVATPKRRLPAERIESFSSGPEAAFVVRCRAEGCSARSGRG